MPTTASRRGSAGRHWLPEVATYLGAVVGQEDCFFRHWSCLETARRTDSIAIMMVIGELPVAPLGLSLLLRLAAPRFIGVVIGVVVRGRCTGLLAGEIGAVWVR